MTPHALQAEALTRVSRRATTSQHEAEQRGLLLLELLLQEGQDLKRPQQQPKQK